MDAVVNLSGLLCSPNRDSVLNGGVFDDVATTRNGLDTGAARLLEDVDQMSEIETIFLAASKLMAGR